ncbi:MULTISPECIES: class I SAM-dependent methyltransferase [unclassified Aureimonas]|uniref:class I SAM-dependent methyltransferase n=1 Tax=unclassified Aureimonas TaxID=2615206 RepID=UPI0009EBD50B|nr:MULTISPECIES: class I SAM-dependent methyltransferase [unclassified Aureimonas]
MPEILPLKDAKDRAGVRSLTACALCGGPRHALPTLGPPSILSDGRIDSRPLRKASCLSCGSSSHAASTVQQVVRASYDRSYDLGIAQDPSAETRGSAYGSAILAALGSDMPKSVLDVGCGSGSLLNSLARHLPGGRLVGVEAATQLAAAASRRGLTIIESFAEDLPLPSKPFDLVCSVNVIEHTHDPAKFLWSLSRQATEDGYVAVVCPRADRPNLELVFQDHIFGLTHQALLRLGQDVGLTLIRYSPTPEEDGDFQLCLFSRKSNGAIQPSLTVDPSSMHRNRVAYLREWQKLDNFLMSQIDGNPLPCFGAGEVAALMRAYAPRAWSYVAELLVDDPATAWRLDRSARVYKRPDAPSPLLIAVHPSRQRMVANRVEGDDYRAICWPDTLGR